MKKFSEWCKQKSLLENQGFADREFTENAQQEEIVNMAMTRLYYQKGYNPETISRMPIQKLMQDIQELGLIPDPSEQIQIERFAAMIKLAANMSHNNMPITPMRNEMTYETTPMRNEMTYETAYKLASWVCLNSASDEYTINIFWSPTNPILACKLEEIRKVLKCCSKDRQMIDTTKLRKLFP